jgi:hypothetical protein
MLIRIFSQGHVTANFPDESLGVQDGFLSHPLTLRWPVSVVWGQCSKSLPVHR